MANMEKLQARQNYRNFWHSDLMETIGADTPYCFFAMFCGPCASYLLRQRALYDDMTRYSCCAGYMPCSGKCGESNCPEFCLCTEVFCCFETRSPLHAFFCKMSSTYKQPNGFMFCLQQVACIFSLVACITGIDELQDTSQIINCLSDMVYCTVCACMQTQHKIEMDKRDGKFGPQAPMSAPPVQQMSRVDQPVHPPATFAPPPVQHPQAGYGPPPVHQPPAGYGPPQAPGQPYSYPLPLPQQPHAHGYPPAGYYQPAYPPPGGHPK